MGLACDMTPPQMADAIRQLRAARSQAEKKITAMKEMEEQLQAGLLMYLDANGLDSARFAGVGTVSKRKDTHVEIRSAEKLAAYVEKALATARANGTSIVDAICVFQTRAAKANILALIEQGYTEEDLGVAVKEKIKLSLTAEK